jgi:hypothetical protein
MTASSSPLLVGMTRNEKRNLFSSFLNHLTPPPATNCNENRDGNVSKKSISNKEREKRILLLFVITLINIY